MGTIAPDPSAPRSRRVAALRWLAWALLIASGLYFLAGAALPYLLRFDEATYGRFWPHAPWLLAHVVGGTFALVLGPLQFWSSVRTRYREFHRWSGRLYLGGVALAAAEAGSGVRRGWPLPRRIRRHR